MRPARVLFVELSEDGTVGGSHQALLDLVRHLDRERFAPVIACYERSAFVERWRRVDAEVHVWEAARAHERAVRGPWWTPWRVATQPLAIWRRLRFLREHEIALVHVNNSPKYSFGDWLPAARLAGVPCISHVRDDPGPLIFPARLLVPHFDRLLAISGYIESRLRDMHLPSARITRVYDGVDAAAVRTRLAKSRAAVRDELACPADAPLVLMVGHLRRWKGQDVLLGAVRMLEPALRARTHVALVGAPDPFDPSFEAKLKLAAADPELATRVHFLGARDDVPDLMRAADVVVHASTTPEPFGLVVLEAMTLGRPVVVSARGGSGEIVTPDSGRSFDPGDLPSLAAILRAILLDPSSAAAMGATAVARAREFSIEATATAVQQVYSDLIGARA